MHVDRVRVTEYMNMRDAEPWSQPAMLTVKGSRVVKIDGGAEAERLEAEIDQNLKKHGDNATVIDSWHGGMNPRARVPSAENRALHGATSGPGLMHFHVGRTLDPISAGVLNHTVEVDGRKLYEGGKTADPR